MESAGFGKVALSVGESETPMAALDGDSSTGGPTWVVNDQVTELAEPLPFLATICQ